MNRDVTQVYCVMIALVFVLGTQATGRADYGPLQSTNRFPLHMLVLTPRPVKVDLPKQGTLEATLAVEYNSTYFTHRNAHWDFLIDMETLVAELSAVYGMTGKLAVRLDLPMLSMGSGFLDGFLQNYHDFLGVPNYDRESRPEDTFAYRVTKDGHTWIQADSGPLRIGDVRMSIQCALAPLNVGGYPVNSAVLVSVKLPTGDSRSGMGSGRYDAGVFLPMQWKRGQWTAYVMPGAMWVGDPETRGAQLSARSSTSLFAGAAYAYNDKWRWLAQVNYFSSPFEACGLNALDAGALEIALGLQRTLNKTVYAEFVFCEDLSYAVPDFNIRMGLTWRFSTGLRGANRKDCHRRGFK
jgi:hypothetical protein